MIIYCVKDPQCNQESKCTKAELHAFLQILKYHARKMYLHASIHVENSWRAENMLVHKDATLDLVEWFVSQQRKKFG